MKSRPHVRPPEDGSEHEDVDFARVDWDWTELSDVTFTRCRFGRLQGPAASLRVVGGRGCFD